MEVDGKCEMTDWEEGFRTPRNCENQIPAVSVFPPPPKKKPMDGREKTHQRMAISSRLILILFFFFCPLENEACA
ncbi:Cyclin-dependent protein kinase inhibitor SMR4 [Quillaja saponaria]|uniref:Cyclin-dependent protein kinase inhibitor SMR4 n=1 Tax=Quillaja saponaria TaxID=32244 RepID=A0AAD7LNR3_QUISA|nr:Cyclin-dependent protein kinase inhibitor SMR4 [Quillaja saponaria]